MSPAATTKYQLVIRQQPKRARMTGFSTDTRLLGPQLILQLIINPETSPQTVLPITETVHMVCTVNLIEHLSNKKSTSKVAEGNNLLGNCASICHYLEDVDGQDGMFFVFPDLGIRSPGKYKLDICLVNVDISKSSFPVLCKLQTREFKVFSPKTFAGAIAPTKLARCVHGQGLDMHIPKRDM